jgi:hypothetical protein
MANVRLWPTVIHTPCTDAADLAAVDVSLYSNGVLASVVNLGVFVYDNTSTAAPDNITVIDPTTGPGRWLVVTPNFSQADVVGGATGSAGAMQEIPFTAQARSFSATSTASAARAVISAAGSGANSDITSLSGLTTPLSVAQGGSGAGTLTGLLVGNGTGAFTTISTSAGLAGQISDETGTGALVFANTPTLVTPVLGAATATSLNLSGLTASQAVFTDSSKNLVSVTTSGVGSVVLRDFATLNGPTITSASLSNTASVYRPTPAVVGTVPYLSITSALDTGLTASTEIPLVTLINTAARTWSAGALTLQRELAVGQPTYAFASASTITDAAAIGLSGPPLPGTNCTITNSHGFYIPQTNLGNNVTNGYGATIWSPTGTAASNIIAQFRGTGQAGRGVGIGTATPVATLSVTRDTSVTTGSVPYLLVTSTADTGLSTTAEVPALSISNSATRTWAAGTIALQREVAVGQPTYAFASSSTMTIGATVGISGSPSQGSNATITDSVGLYVASGTVTATRTHGMWVRAQNGGSSGVFAATFTGATSSGNCVQIGTSTAGDATLHITRDTAATFGSRPYLRVAATGDTGLTASTETPIFAVNGGVTRQWATGTLSVQGDNVFGQNTIAFVGASNGNNVATVRIAGAPIAGTNATFSNTHGLLISAGSSVTSSATNSYGLTVTTQSGATNNYCAQFLSGSVGIGIAAPTDTLTISRNVAATSGSARYFSITPAADTGLTASTESSIFQIVAGSSRTWAAGNIATQRQAVMRQNPISFDGASTVTDAMTFAVTSAPTVGTNCTITNGHAIYIGGGISLAGTTNSYGITCNAPNGATNNYAAQFIGGNTGFGTASPASMVHILKTTEQLRVAYDGSNYYSTTVASNGAVTFDATGAGAAFTFSDAVTTPALTATGTITNSGGGSMVNKNFTANSSTAITLATSDGKSQVITLTGNATITMPASPASGSEVELIVELVQDGTGGRTVTWSGVTWATTGGVAPAINSAIGASTYFSFRGNNAAGWIGFAANQNLGITDGSNAAAGYIGEVISSSVAIGSAVSLTTATAANITSISLTPGDWMVSGNIGFIPAGTTVPTRFVGSVSSTSATQATSPNGGAFFQLGVTTSTGVSQVFTLAPTRINVTTTTTYYLVATTDFTVSTMTGYGAITARRFR